MNYFKRNNICKKCRHETVHPRVFNGDIYCEDCNPDANFKCSACNVKTKDIVCEKCYNEFCLEHCISYLNNKLDYKVECINCYGDADAKQRWLDYKNK